MIIQPLSHSVQRILKHCTTDRTDKAQKKRKHITAMLGSIAVPVLSGLAVGIVFIVLFSTVGTNSLVYYPRYDFPRYDLGDKDELVSKFSEYFAREPDNAVKIGNGGYVGRIDHAIDVHAYPLIADYDSKNHGTLRIFTYRDEVRVQAVSIQWRTHGEPELVNADRKSTRLNSSH